MILVMEKNMMRAALLALLFAWLPFAAASGPDRPIVLVAKPALRDPLYGATVLVVTPIGNDQHVGFIINRPTNVPLGKVFPEHGPSQKIVDPVYLGGPVETQAIFALVERDESPGGASVELMPGLFAVLDARTVDGIIESGGRQAKFVAGFVLWRPGELESELEQGAWYTQDADPSVALRKPEGLWEELVRRASRVRAERRTRFGPSAARPRPPGLADDDVDDAREVGGLRHARAARPAAHQLGRHAEPLGERRRSAHDARRVAHAARVRILRHGSDPSRSCRMPSVPSRARSC